MTAVTHQIQDLPGDDEVVEVVHDFFDGGAEVPEVEVEDVDVCCAELFEGGGEAGFDGFGGVAAEVDSGVDVWVSEGGFD